MPRPQQPRRLLVRIGRSWRVLLLAVAGAVGAAEPVPETEPKATPTPAAPAATPAPESVIVNRGKSSPVPGQGHPPTEDTVKGRYWKSVHDAIGRQWYALIRPAMGNSPDVQNSDVLVSFNIDKLGKVSNFKVVSGSESKTAREVAMSAVKNSTLPPPPKELIQKKSGLTEEHRIHFTVYDLPSTPKPSP